RKWAKNLDAQCWLWKDHTSWREAARITELAAQHRPHLIAKCGNTYSSEWFWAKIWHCLNVAPKVFGAAFSWVELADWVPSVLAGVADPREIKRGVCMAGHKALDSEERSEERRGGKEYSLLWESLHIYRRNRKCVKTDEQYVSI